MTRRERGMKVPGWLIVALMFSSAESGPPCGMRGWEPASDGDARAAPLAVAI